jgi:hypothetical protein
MLASGPIAVALMSLTAAKQPAAEPPPGPPAARLA